MARQTAVEWLAEQFEESYSYINEIFKETIEQAKQMEKEQMKDAYDKGKWSDKFAPDDSFKAYYNKYYEKEGDYDDYQERLKYLKDL